MKQTCLLHMGELSKPSFSPSARERILATATELFLREGYRAVGIDRIIELAGVAKTSLYRNFASKDELIAAYLERADQEFWHWFEDAIADAPSPQAKLIALFDATEKLATSPQCLGCTFQVAAGEFPEPEHPAHRVAVAHKLKVLQRLRELADEAGADDPTALAEQLMLIMDGAWAAARMLGPDNQAATAGAAARTLLNASVSSHDGRPRPAR
jgi:AcrR family transcriptional regulator